jgi:hypothetical protein
MNICHNNIFPSILITFGGYMVRASIDPRDYDNVAGTFGNCAARQNFAMVRQNGLTHIVSAVLCKRNNS